MPLLGALNSGLTGLFARQKAIEVTGNNIANVNTPGYSRQVLDLTPAPALNVQGQMIGQGVDVLDVKREYDSFLTNQLKDKNALLGEHSAKSGPLSEVQRIFGIGESALANDIETFFGSWHELSVNPDGNIERDQVLYAGENMLASFEDMRGDLVHVKQNINDTIDSKLVDINQKLEEVAELNESIQNREVSGMVATSDRDRRDLLVKELSGLLGCKTFKTGKSGIALQLPGNGVPLVQGINAYPLDGEYVKTDLQLSIQVGQSTMELSRTDLGGEIRGLLDVRDEVVPELTDGLDKLEYNIVNAVNIQHEAGFGLDGRTGRSFFTRSASLRSETGFTDPEDLAFNTGTIEITVGGGTPHEVDIDQGENSLNGIRDAINAADTGALASVVFDGTDYHLDLIPKTEGESISVDATGLSSEEFDAEFDEDFSLQADGSYIYGNDADTSDDTFSDPDALTFGKGSFTLSVDGEDTEVSIGPGENSLQGIRDAINASDAAVSASITGDDTAGYSLVLRPDLDSASVSKTATTLTDSDEGFVNWVDIEAEPSTRVNITSTEQIAAGFESKSGDNQNALAISALGQSAVIDDEETFVGFYGGLSSKIGVEAQRNTMALGGAQDTVTQLENMRESIVGVSIEQEMINLTLYQTGFEACSRLVTTVDELMQTVLNMKR